MGPCRVGVCVATNLVAAVSVRADRVAARHTVAGVPDALTDLLADAIHHAGTDAPVTVTGDALDNAFDHPSRLRRVAVLRLGPTATSVLPPFTGWPATVRAAVEGPVAAATGGHDLARQALAPLGRDAVRRAAAAAADQGVHQLVISSPGSCGQPAHELEAADLVRAENPELTLTLSHELGGLGLRERENGAALSAALRDAATRFVDEVEDALARAGFKYPPTFVGNGATVLAAEHVRRFPALFVSGAWAAAGRGAAWLTNSRHLRVMDTASARHRSGMVVDGRPAVPHGPREVRGVRVAIDVPDLTEEPATGSGMHDTAAGFVVRTGPGRAAVSGADAGPANDADDLRVAAAVGAATAMPAAVAERLVVASGSDELAAATRELEHEAVSRLGTTTYAGPVPMTAYVSSVRVTPVSYLPRGVHHVVVRAELRPGPMGPS